jgi:carboxylesterase
MQRVLPTVSVPTLIIHSRNDGSVPHEDAEIIHNKIGSDDKELLWLEKSGHNITRDAEREIAFNATAEFIRRVSSENIS